MNIEPEPHHEPPRTGLKWLDGALAIAILLVSVSSLVIAIVHSRTLERLADANVRLVEANSWPFLAYSTGNVTDGKPVINMSVDNNGVGPAKIEYFAVTWNRVPQRNAAELLKSCCGYQPRKGERLLLHEEVQGQVLRPGARLNFLYFLRTPQNAAAWDQLNDGRLSKKLDVNICYCSVFDECWGGDITEFTLHPKRMAKCAASRISFE